MGQGIGLKSKMLNHGLNHGLFISLHTYSRVPNNRGVRITVLVGKILEINNHVGPNNSVGRIKS